MCVCVCGEKSQPVPQHPGVSPPHLLISSVNALISQVKGQITTTRHVYVSESWGSEMKDGGDYLVCEGPKRSTQSTMLRASNSVK